MNCKNCEKPLNDDDLFCSKCGEKVIVEDIPDDVQEDIIENVQEEKEETSTSNSNNMYKLRDSKLMSLLMLYDTQITTGIIALIVICLVTFITYSNVFTTKITPPPTPTPKPDYFKLASDNYNNKQYVEAFKNYKDIPSGDVNYQLAQNKIKDILDSKCKTYLQQAQEAFVNKKYDEAIEKINAVLEIKPDDKEIQATQVKYSSAKDEFEKEKERQEEEKRQAETKKKHEGEILVDKDGKTIRKLYLDQGVFWFKGDYQGNGNFIVTLKDSNYNLYKLIVNEIGDYKIEKTVPIYNSGYYIFEVYGTRGEWSYNWNN